MIRRDGRPGGPAPRPAPARAWSEAPEPQAYSRTPGGPPPRGSGHAPTQTPRPYAEPRRTPPAAPPRGPQPPRPPAAPAEPPKQRRPRKRGTWLRRVALTLAVLLVASIGGVVYLDTKLNRVDALADYPGRVADTPGTNWLLVGSDSRAGLTADQDRALAAGGDIDGKRTDTIMLVHVPKSGATTMVSIPRDSYVNIPGIGRGKINAAFAQEDGEQLLVQTVEEATGLRIDHYAEIGFGGFAGIVDALGGVNMCVPYPIDDPLAGINLPAGCQDLSGPEALGFVRSRATALADLDRMNNQRAFMSALLKKATSPTTLINPLRLWPMMTQTANSLQVADGDHLWNLAGLAWALRGKMVTTTVPVGGFEVVDGWGDVLLWDREKASEFFDALANDRQIPQGLLTGTP
ncbi:LytR family transcriptional regulator [Prescottella agglutinans]|uniref:LytR family transcriptional regulator n=1 Tax=Prescottella agglutinans TaxID=1644129 RepID=A0A3S3ARU8_9NOCA|nr:LCP family protein [Prescottella agglutinans]RVW06959.1 LytR family transcriptional regulator [Prescottella agglutinans]